ncbi:hypothetical protein Tsubulata_012742 [Turnera subulata]|uniref:Cytochrome P450 n=1 Tax=Turnera subulata TaxID=218843 RepID=A0A9Q0GGG5_9ROSI|nr:hypothetical protein Tsubulata_012742 [Turnera subulata]
MASILVNLEIILVVTGCFILILCGFRNYHGGLPRNWPLVGMLPALLTKVHRIHDWCTQVLEQSHFTFRFRGLWSSNMDWLITADPSNIHYITCSNFSNFQKGPEFKKFFDILGDGIFNSDSDMWKSQRKLAQELISHLLFYKFLVKASLEKVEKGLIPILDHVSKQGLVVDLQDLLQRFTFEATCLVFTGHDPGCLSISFPKVAFSRAVDDAEEAIFFRHILPQSLWKLQRRLDIGVEKKHKRARETIDRILSEIISAKKEEVAKRREKKEMDDGRGIDLLSSYIMEDATIMGSSKSSDDKFLRDTIFTLLAAGRDTTGSALSWFFWLVTTNPLVEKKIREELKATIQPEADQSGGGREWRLFDVEVLKRLPYLHGALCESLRLYPPVPFNHKSPLKPDILPSGHRVNPDMKIYISLYSLGRMTSIWGHDCLEFKPERWTDSGGIKHEPYYKFSTFSAGPRTCLGKNIAFLQMKILAASIIYNYNIQLVAGQTITPSPSVILHMKHGMKVKLFKRTCL